MNTIIPFAYESIHPDSVPTPRIFKDSEEIVQELKPIMPVYTLDIGQIANTASAFMAAFPGQSLFAVKTNPHPIVIQTLYQAGMRGFDVASLAEIALVRRAAPDAALYYMHTVKPFEHIRCAYFEYGVRHFSLDHPGELEKILRATDYADDLTLFVRIALPHNDQADIDFSDKFGARVDDAPLLLKKARAVARTLGVCFHVGTQTVDAAAYGNAVNIVKSVIRNSGVKVDALDVGGGFPVAYDEDVPSFVNCIDVIRCALMHAGLDHLPLFAEPGRCLVAQGGSLIVRVELRKGNTLYLNDGTYGGLFDAGPSLKTPFPVRRIANAPTNLVPFRFAGPTCDGLDMMEGPFMLPETIQDGDYIEIFNTGAYSQALRSDFNGFGGCDTVLVSKV